MVIDWIEFITPQLTIKTPVQNSFMCHSFPCNQWIDCGPETLNRADRIMCKSYDKGDIARIVAVNEVILGL